MTLPIFMFIYMLREKCETNQCKYRDCGLRKRRLWKTDDALALALPEREPDKMQFVKKYKAKYNNEIQLQIQYKFNLLISGRKTEQ